MLIDLTHTFTNGMPVYPGDPCAKLYQTAHIEKDGFNMFAMESGLHVGTHMDAPLHMIDGAAYICDIPLPQFQGRGVLLDARGHDRVDIDLLNGKDIRAGDIILVHTAWDQYFGKDDNKYFNDYPLLTPAFAEALAAKQISLIGMDTPSPDQDPFPVHKIFLKQQILIIENVTNLAGLLPYVDFTVSAYPLKLKAEASPIRIVAEIT